MRRHKRLIIVLGVISSITILCGLYLAFFTRLKLFTPPEPLPTFAPREIQQLCTLLHLGEDEPFCTNFLGKNAFAVNEMLQRNFPPGVATYSDVIRYFNQFPAISFTDCPGRDDTQYRRYELGNCPPLMNCQGKYHTTCNFDLPGRPAAITVVFENSTETVEKIIGENTSDDS